MYRAGLSGGWALAALLLAPGLAPAAWDNVFQLTCCGTPRVSNRIAAAPPCCPPPPTCCPQTAYVQRSFYQPTTSYRPVVSYEPVTSYRTSYYYEPIQTVSYSLSVDPCTGCATQVAVPQTAYQLKSQCNAVTNYVQRIAYQPVTTYRQSFYYDPVTVQTPCCPPTVATAAPVPTLAVPPATFAPPATSEQTFPPPGAAPAATPPLNYTPENRMPTETNKVSPNVNRPVPPAPASGFRPDRLASAESTIQGSIVRSDFQARPGAKIRFVSASGREFVPVQADASGRFRVSLSSGTYTIYTEDATGRPKAHSEFVVRGAENRNVTVVAN